jgi:hypothetical protein
VEALTGIAIGGCAILAAGGIAALGYVAGAALQARLDRRPRIRRGR